MFLFELELNGSKEATSKKIADNKEPSVATLQPSKVDGIISALSELETNIDSLDEKLAYMKKELNQKATKEIDKFKEQVIQMATKEAATIIANARDKAKLESQKIVTESDANLKDVQNKIDAKFNEAVDHVVSTVLKA